MIISVHAMRFAQFRCLCQLTRGDKHALGCVNGDPPYRMRDSVRLCHKNAGPACFIALVGLAFVVAADRAPLRLAAASLPSSSRRISAGARSGTAQNVDDLLQQMQAALDTNSVSVLRSLSARLANLRVSQALSSDQWLNAGRILATAGLYADAALLFGYCTDQHPNEFACHNNLVLAELEAGRPKAAFAGLNRIPPGQRQQPAFHYLRGKVEAALGNHADAERELAAAVAGAPGEENYSVDLAMEYISDHRYSAALDTLQPALASHPNAPYLWLASSLANFFAGHYDECQASARRALTLNAAFQPARLLLAYAQFVTGKIATAEETCAAGLARRGTDAFLNYFDADLLLRLGSNDSARMLRELEIAKAAIPKCVLCELTESKVHERRGDLPRAIAALKRAVAADPQFADAWYRLARLEQRAGQPKQAAEAEAMFQQIKTKTRDDENRRLQQLFMQALGQSSGSQ